MTSSRIYGDWRNTLPGYLRKQYPNPVTLTDDQLADITGSIDERKSSPYFPIDDNPTWSIRQYAAEAGYSVDYKSTDKRIKIFSPIVKTSALL